MFHNTLPDLRVNPRDSQQILPSNEMDLGANLSDQVHLRFKIATRPSWRGRHVAASDISRTLFNEKYKFREIVVFSFHFVYQEVHYRSWREGRRIFAYFAVLNKFSKVFAVSQLTWFQKLQKSHQQVGKRECRERKMWAKEKWTLYN